MLCHRIAMLCHRTAMSERRNAMLRHRTAMLCHRNAMSERRIAMSERRIAMLRHRIAMSERRIAMLRHRIAMSERRSQECPTISRPAGADFATPSRDFSRQAAPHKKSTTIHNSSQASASSADPSRNGHPRQNKSPSVRSWPQNCIVRRFYWSRRGSNGAGHIPL